MPKYEVEVSTTENGDWLFPGNNQRMRGQWDYRRVNHLDIGDKHKGLQRITQTIPGIRIAIDIAQKTVVLHDPLLTTDEGRRLWREIHGIANGMNDTGSTFEPWDTVKHDLSKTADPATELKNWMYWCARGLETGKAIKTTESKEWPSCDEIDKWQGRRIVHPYDQNKVRREMFGDPVLSDKLATGAT